MMLKSVRLSMQVGAIASCGWLLTLQPAFAHHAMDGRMPTNALEGFLSGLAHPVIGIDHLAFVIAIGLLSSQYERGWSLPGFFLSAAMLGAGMHLLQIALPIPESMVALSVIALGVILLIGRKLNSVVLAGLFAIAGLFHGYAYGEAIFGAEMTPLVSYLIGFTVVQGAITAAAYLMGAVATRGSSLSRAYGILACAIGAMFLAMSLKG